VNDQEYRDVLEYVRARMVEYGFGALDERIESELRRDPGHSEVQLLQYLQAVETEVRLGGTAIVRTVVDRLADVVITETGDSVDGITIELTEGDADFYGRHRVELVGISELDALAAEISHLRAMLRTSGEQGQWR